MMSERIIELRRQLAERLPNSRSFSGDFRPPSHKAFPPHLQIQGLLRNLSPGTVTELIADKNASGSALFIASVLQHAVETNQVLALVDGQDSFDPTSFSNETLSRLLWVRCKSAAQALKAIDLILRDRNLPLVLLDLRLNPAAQLRKTPSSAWYRLQRIVEATSAVFIVVTPSAMVGSAQLRLNLKNQFGLESLHMPEQELVEQLRVEISRSRLHVEAPPQSLDAAG